MFGLTLCGLNLILHKIVFSSRLEKNTKIYRQKLALNWYSNSYELLNMNKLYWEYNFFQDFNL